MKTTKVPSKRIRCLSEFWVPLYADLTLLHAQGHIWGTTTSNRQRLSQFMMECIQPAETLLTVLTKATEGFVWAHNSRVESTSGGKECQPAVQEAELASSCLSVQGLNPWNGSAHISSESVHGEWPNPAKLTTNGNHYRWMLTSRN